jgi:outer membrane protein assembly factor BamB
MPAMTYAETLLYSSQQLSFSEKFLLRKTYPYENRALHTQECFSKELTSPDDEKISSSSFGSSYPVGLNGSMNSSWPMKSYNAQRIGRTTSSTADNPGIEKWRFNTYIAGVDNGAAIANDGIIYFGSQDERLYALYPNGTLKWFYKTGMPIWSDPALAEDGTIYITSCDYYLYALRPDGTLKWRFNTGEIISSSPVIANNGTIYIGNSQGRVFAMNPNGTEQWHYDLPNDIYGSPALGTDGTIYFGCWDNRFYALNPNGTLKWWFPTGDHVKGVPSMAPDGTIYFGSWDGYLYALYPNGTMRWSCRVGSGTETTPALAEDGTIYVGGDELYAVYPNGTLRWTLSLGSGGHIFMSCPAVAAEGTIYVGVDVGNDVAGEIFAVNPNGTIRWQKIISDEHVDSSPAIAADGTVYIGSTGIYYGTSFHAFGAVETNTPPNPPAIEGSTKGKAGTEYSYYFQTSDPDNNPVQVYVDWGDGTNEWSYITASGQTILMSHTWTEQGSYIIKAKTRDTFGAESNWTTLQVTMPLAYEPPHFRFLDWLFDRFPNAFPILRQILKQE